MIVPLTFTDVLTFSVSFWLEFSLLFTLSCLIFCVYVRNFITLFEVVWEAIDSADTSLTVSEDRYRRLLGLSDLTGGDDDSSHARFLRYEYELYRRASDLTYPTIHVVPVL